MSVSIRRSRVTRFGVRGFAGRGFTLVEALVAISLSLLIVAVVASACSQVQKSIDDLRMRADASIKVQAAFTDIERDLARMVADLTTPAPFSQLTTVPVPLAMNSPAVASQPSDPTGFVRKGDTLTIFTITSAGQRAVVEDRLDGASDAAAVWAPLPAGGLYVSHLRRHVLAAAIPGDTLATMGQEQNFSTTSNLTSTSGTPWPAGTSGGIETPVIYVDNVVSFGLAYIPAGATAFVPVASGQSPQFFLPTGQLDVVNYTASAHGTLDAAVLSAVPVGFPLEIAINGAWTLPTGVFTVRRWTAGSLTSTPPVVSQVLLSDHVNVSPTVSFNADGPPPSQTVSARAFTPPVVLGVTIVVRYGFGPNAPIMTFRREIPVSRS